MLFRSPAAGEVSHTVAEIVVENDRTPALTLEAMGVDGMWMWGRAVAGNTSASRFTSGFELAGLDPAEPVAVQVDLWGGSETNHLVEISLNDQLLGGTNWSGETPVSARLNAPAGLLRNGNNTLLVQARGSALSRIYVDRLILRTSRLLTMEAGGIVFRSEGGDTTLGGLFGSGLHVFRLGPGVFDGVDGVSSDVVDGESRATFRAAAGQYAAVESGRELTPAQMEGVWLKGLSTRRRKLDQEIGRAHV